MHFRYSTFTSTDAQISYWAMLINSVNKSRLWVPSSSLITKHLECLSLAHQKEAAAVVVVCNMLICSKTRKIKRPSPFHFKYKLHSKKKCEKGWKWGNLCALRRLKKVVYTTQQHKKKNIIKSFTISFPNTQFFSRPLQLCCAVAVVSFTSFFLFSFT